MREWARRIARRDATFVAMHPGWSDTPGLAASLPAFHGLMGPLLRTPESGIDTVVWLAAHPDAADATGQLFLDRRPRPFDRAPQTRLSAADRRRLWDRVVALANVADPAPYATAGRAAHTGPASSETSAGASDGARDSSAA